MQQPPGMATTADWMEEDTEVAPDEDVRRGLQGSHPSYDLVWVEEEGMGMVLRIQRIVNDPN